MQSRVGNSRSKTHKIGHQLACLSLRAKGRKPGGWSSQPAGCRNGADGWPPPPQGSRGAWATSYFGLTLIAASQPSSISGSIRPGCTCGHLENGLHYITKTTHRLTALYLRLRSREIQVAPHGSSNHSILSFTYSLPRPLGPKSKASSPDSGCPATKCPSSRVHHHKSHLCEWAIRVVSCSPFRSPTEVVHEIERPHANIAPLGQIASRGNVQLGL